MNTRQLGTSDLHITPIGFGAWAIGGSGWEFAWGSQDDRDSIAAIREGLSDMKAGRSRPARAALKALARKYGIATKSE